MAVKLVGTNNRLTRRGVGNESKVGPLSGSQKSALERSKSSTKITSERCKQNQEWNRNEHGETSIQELMKMILRCYSINTGGFLPW